METPSIPKNEQPEGQSGPEVVKVKEYNGADWLCYWNRGVMKFTF